MLTGVESHLPHPSPQALLQSPSSPFHPPPSLGSLSGASPGGLTKPSSPTQHSLGAALIPEF